jgi:uridylate kinase
MEKKIFIVSVGGSLIFSEGIDILFLKRFKKLIMKYIRKGFKAIVVCGGGKISRIYQKAAKKIVKLSKEDLDWLGIQGTKINAYLIKIIFKKDAYREIVDNPTKKIDFKERVLVASGWKPGFSTDYDAVLLAKNFGVKRIINLTNVDYVYTKDPTRFKDAKPIKEISWKEFRKILPKKWSPGLNVPFDPVAAKEAEKLKLEVVIMNGKNLRNFENYLKGKPFIGTKIFGE